MAFYLYRFDEKTPVTRKSVAEYIGNMSSLIMRIQNFKAIDTDGESGLCNYSGQSKRVFDKYCHLDEKTVYDKCADIMKNFHE